MDATISLDKAQRETLMRHYLRDGVGEVCIHCQMLLLLDDGRTTADVARLTLSEPEEVNDCVRRFQEAGVEAVIRGV